MIKYTMKNTFGKQIHNYFFFKGISLAENTQKAQGQFIILC